MARRRLPPPGSVPSDLPPQDKGVPSIFADVGVPLSRPPVARVAAESAAEAALRDLSTQMAELRNSGRMVLEIALEQIDEAYLLRDRQAVDAEEMEALVTSLRAHGQRQPIEVAEGAVRGRYGLIAGWRRLTALKRLQQEDPARFGHVLALVRSPETAAEAYVAMIEENEIRAGLSYWERARLVLRATEAGVFADQREALRMLFASASRAKRSKIGSFTEVVTALEGVLHYPEALPERAGLSLAKALGERPDLIESLREALARQKPATAAAELAVVAEVLAGRPKAPTSSQQAASKRRDLAPGLWIETNKGSISLGGKALDHELLARLEDWLRRETGR